MHDAPVGADAGSHDATGASEASDTSDTQGPAVTACTQYAAKGYTVETSQSARSDQDGDHFHQIWTHSDCTVYFSWVDAKNRWMVGQKTPGGKVTTAALMTDIKEDRYHNLPSIAVDRDGFIHAFGPMHHYKWHYRVSDQPGDISAFHDGQSTGRALPRGVDGTYQDCGPDWITYPNAVKDGDGDIYVSFRMRVSGGSWDAGDMSGNLARYDVRQKRWTALGGASYEYSKYPCLIWIKEGSGGTAYQGYNLHPTVDRDGRLHLAFAINRNTGTSTSWKEEVHYVYSDDKGATWHTVNGDPVPSLPILPTDKTRVRDAEEEKTLTYGFAIAHLDSSGKPVVSYQLKSDGPSVSRWTGSQWTHAKLGGGFPGRLFIDSNGLWTRFSSSGLEVSGDDGKSWKKYPRTLGSTQNMNVDMAYFKDTNLIRFVDHAADTSGPWQVVTFAPDEWQPPH
jgi:hypothetical protein